MDGPIIFLALVALASTAAMASDPSQLQDFCVADKNSAVFVNGFACKDPNTVTADNFFFSGLDKPGNTSNAGGSSVTPVAVDQVPGLNTLGISLARLDFAPYGLIPPHTHPRATELFTVLEGSILVGFVTSNPGNKQFTKVLNKGDAFVFPQGLIHYQYNIGATSAFAISGLSSQNPGVILVPNAVFGSTPPISDEVLAKAFQVSKQTVDMIQAKF
ncbi:putative germin-like protein 2-1 [Zingiber officinale]|uniref:Cupin type-1 domain-containing protein n=1 Tax=Zingiber officinale TaxID=94328 RepID=A0A8J5GCE6_ZINOF|nr:putative germin-like protein 2-1 [Zingiber officinale]KAG6496952.1 hypothetical protein ZIOFF_044832 [Zingiber officinale]